MSFHFCIYRLVANLIKHDGRVSLQCQWNFKIYTITILQFSNKIINSRLLRLDKNLNYLQVYTPKCLSTRRTNSKTKRGTEPTKNRSVNGTGDCHSTRRRIREMNHLTLCALSTSVPCEEYQPTLFYSSFDYLPIVNLLRWNTMPA